MYKRQTFSGSVRPVDILLLFLAPLLSLGRLALYVGRIKSAKLDKPKQRDYASTTTVYSNWLAIALSPVQT